MIDEKQTYGQSPFREFINVHKADIFDIHWSSKSLFLIITASADQTVALYNITLDKPLQIFQHPDIVSACSFKVNVSQIFPYLQSLPNQSDTYITTGCFDKFLRLWSVKQKKVVDWQQTNNYITALQYTPCSTKLIVGLVNGEVLIFDAT